MKRLITLILFLLTGVPTWSQSFKESLDSVMTSYINERKLHGSVAFVQKDGSVILNKAYGYKNVEKKEVMETNTIFNIASMAKIITSAGALKLYEQGEFLLDDPIKKFLPEINNLKIWKPSGLVELERDVTIRDLFRHTAGFGYVEESTDIKTPVDSLYVSSELGRSKTSDEFLRKLSQIPLIYQPGSEWEYSYSIDVLGF